MSHVVRSESNSCFCFRDEMSFMDYDDHMRHSYHQVWHIFAL